MIRDLISIVTGLLEAVIHIVLGLAGFGGRHPVLGLIMLAVLAAVVLFWKVVLGRRSQGWRRARSIRFRLWLWLRPGAGFASLPELWLRWGRWLRCHPAAVPGQACGAG